MWLHFIKSLNVSSTSMSKGAISRDLDFSISLFTRLDSLKDEIWLSSAYALAASTFEKGRAWVENIFILGALRLGCSVIGVDVVCSDCSIETNLFASFSSSFTKSFPNPFKRVSSIVLIYSTSAKLAKVFRVIALLKFEVLLAKLYCGFSSITFVE